MGMTERVNPWKGHVSLRAFDAMTGELVDTVETDNVYTDWAAVKYAQALGGSAVTLTLSHIDLGFGGYPLSLCNSTSGWSATPTLDSSVYREGTGSLKGTAAASGSVVYANTASVGGTVSILGGSVQASLRLTSRSLVDLAGSEVRVYTGTAYRKMTFAAIEASSGVAMADATWTSQRVSTTDAGWTTGAGTPSWGTVTGVGVVVKAAGAGTATVHWDQMLAMPGYGTAGTVLQTLSATPGGNGLSALTSLAVSGGTITAKTAWTDNASVGDFLYTGLYANAGATCFAIAPLAYYKPAGVVLTLTWTVTVSGG